MTSCSTISYVPNVSLDVSPKTINRSVQVERFIDSSPIADRRNPFGGFSVTNAGSLSNSLDIEVTNAVVADFATNAVFKQVSRKIDNPDFILKGEIIEFSGKSELNNFTKITMGIAAASMVLASVTDDPRFILGITPIYTWYLGIPISKHSANIEIVMRLYDKNNTLIGTYTGKAYDKNASSLYKNRALAVPRLTNKTFSSAIMQIRDQILNDISNIEK